MDEKDKIIADLKAEINGLKAKNAVNEGVLKKRITENQRPILERLYLLDSVLFAELIETFPLYPSMEIPSKGQTLTMPDMNGKTNLLNDALTAPK